MHATIESPPAFTIRQRDPEELGDLFLEVAMRGVSNSQGPSHAMIVENAIRTAALFVESIAEIQSQQSK